MKISEHILPQKIYLEDYNGDYHLFIDAIYTIFHNDFIKNKAYFGTYPLAMKFHPLFQDRAYTFYHMTHKGEIENEREPDLRRCERIPWAKPTIEKTIDYSLKFWEQERHGKHRVCIWLETDKDNYFVILDVRKSYVLLWTAFYAEFQSQIDKKMSEYEEWKSMVGGIAYTPDMLIKDIQSRL